MTTFTIQGEDIDDCKQKVREKHGERAQILQEKTIRLGGFLGMFTREGCEVTGYVPDLPPKPDMSKYASSIFKNAQTNRNPPLLAAGSHAENISKVLQEAAIATGADPKMQELLIQVKNLTEATKNISEKLDEKTAASAEHENIERLRDLLEQNDFDKSYRKEIIGRVRKELTLEELDDFDEVQQRVLKMIAMDIKIYDTSKPVRLPRIIVLAGPTGVGKTTTIAKLAAGFKFGEADGRQYTVGLITLDNYRIAATEQLEQYSNILKLPFAKPIDEDELKRELTLLMDTTDIILIDTAGKSPRDAVALGETKKLLDVCGSRTEVYLALAAPTKTADITEIMRQFEPFAYRAVIITKLDETRQIGNVLSALIDNGKPVAWITNGQESTHEKIKKADRMQLMLHMDGFDMNRDRLQKEIEIGEIANG
ncbi:flagellar biosynthesis protein FlhF [Spirochaetia bacterium]|nr:flagellar biosynthesis protein FlhF [Spirochaetia bacterium]